MTRVVHRHPRVAAGFGSAVGGTLRRVPSVRYVERNLYQIRMRTQGLRYKNLVCGRRCLVMSISHLYFLFRRRQIQEVKWTESEGENMRLSVMQGIEVRLR